VSDTWNPARTVRKVEFRLLQIITLRLSRASGPWCSGRWVSKNHTRSDAGVSFGELLEAR
jgi:hypothetical protein